MEKVAKPVDYVVRVKTKLGDRHMSDKALGARWGLSSSSISNARYDEMTDNVALKIAEVLEIPAGEVLWVARTAREKDPVTKGHLEAWGRHVGKALALVPAKVAAFVAAMALGALPAHDAQAFGGAGRFRRTV